MYDQMTEGEVLAAARAIADKTRTDDFLIRLFRKDSIGGHRGELFVALGGATLENLSMREMWMPDLIGKGKGGIFEVSCWHVSDKLAQVGAPLYYTQPGPPAPPNTGALNDANWNGPRVLLYPRDLAASAPVDVLRLGANGEDSGSGAQLRREAAMGASPATDLAQKTMKAAEDLDRRERDLTEKRHRMELEDLHTRMKREIEELRARVETRPAAPIAVAEPRGSLFKEFLEFAPTLQGFLRDWKDVRHAEIAAAREQASSLAQVMKDSAERQAQAFERVQVKNDERLERLFSEMSKNRGGDGAVLKAQTEATGAMANMALSMIHNAKALLPSSQPGEDKNLVLEIVDKTMPTLEKFFDSMLTNAQARRIEAERGLPPGDQQQQTVSTTATRQPAAVTPPPPPPPRSTRAPNSIDEMVAQVKKFTDPAAVAAYFFDVAASTPEMNDALNENGRDVTKTLGALAIAHLKTWYAKDPKRAEAYLERIEKEITKVGKERGQVSEADDAPPAEETKPELPAIDVETEHVDGLNVKASKGGPVEPDASPTAEA